MHEPKPLIPLTDYRVSIGHAVVHVRVDSRESAIREARRRLCLEMPRMWDVIERLADSRFDVVPPE
jgi:hypothetical protein